jgi:UTP--glucose-1-phosphate uridylyltransferase
MTPDLFDCIKQVSRAIKSGPLLTDAIRLLLNEHPVYAYVFDGLKYNAGEIGYLKAVIDCALERDDCAQESLVLWRRS